MDISQYLESTGTTQAKFASDLGVAPGFVWQWVRGKRPVPAEWCVAIERLTGQAVTRRDLRPEDWPRIWPELEQPEQVGAAEAA